MTREVRWFHHGPVPSSVIDWFTIDSHQVEERVDCYDLASARNGIGRKHRSDTSLDIKFRIEIFPSISFAPGLIGQVEDWMKISEPLNDSPEQALNEPFPISKVLVTRRFPFSDDDDSGCEVELADIEAGTIRAWSLCFETFGAADRREEALLAGFQPVAETPLPGDVVFEQEASISYPDWLHQHAYQWT